MKAHHHLGSILAILIGAYVAITAYKLGLGSLHRPGAGFIFFWAAVLLIVLAATDLGISIPGRAREISDEKPLWKGFRWHKVVLVLAGLSASTYFFNGLGFLLSTFFVMLFLFKIVEPFKWVNAILGSLLTLAIVYAVFGIWLKVPFPSGFLGF
jgi:putative tricarboxylic transport membrane protein